MNRETCFSCPLTIKDRRNSFFFFTMKFGSFDNNVHFLSSPRVFLPSQSISSLCLSSFYLSSLLFYLLYSLSLSLSLSHRITLLTSTWCHSHSASFSMIVDCCLSSWRFEPAHMLDSHDK